MKNALKAYVCVVEDYEGNKKNCRAFASSAVKARERLIKDFPDCYVSPAISLKEFTKSKRP